MNKVMNVIANKIIDLLRGRPALKVGEVSVWGDFSHDEKERLRLILLDGRNAREKEKELEERIAELEADETQLIQERDCAEAALSDMYEAATGERPEWSNWFGFADAVEEVTQVRAKLALVREQRDNELRTNMELEKRLATPVRLSCETHPRCRTQHAKDVHAAGFTVTVERDEEPCHEKA